VLYFFTLFNRSENAKEEGFSVLVSGGSVILPPRNALVGVLLFEMHCLLIPDGYHMKQRRKTSRQVVIWDQPQMRMCCAFPV
jgi:hypothetical protein